MSKFVQLHLLTSYPPANLNRDDLGRPKTAMMGGANRLRVSSQSLKRAWRRSELFESALAGHVGTRTKEMGRQVYQQLIEKGVSEKNAKKWAKSIAAEFGSLKKADKEDPLLDLEIEQLAHFSPEEEQAIKELIEAISATGEAPASAQLDLLRKQHSAADIALFGRMLTKSDGGRSLTQYCSEAAAQVAHALSVHKVSIEDDFFTAVDDLNKGDEDRGAGHMGETEFAAGLFYLYLCIDRDLLMENLGGDEDLTNRTLGAVIQAAATVSPSGKQNSFASRARASYILCESGDEQPRSLSVAFLRPVDGTDMLTHAVQALDVTRSNLNKVYGDAPIHTSHMNASTGEGSLQAIISCATGG